MKKTIIKSIFTTFILVLLTISCSKEEKVENELELSTTQINFPKSGGTAVVGVYSTYPWGVVPNEYDFWIKYELSENRIIINCPSNNTGSNRSGHLEVSSAYSSYPIQISIFQSKD